MLFISFFMKKNLILRQEKEFNFIWVPVAHVYNPSYSGSRDQKDGGSKPAWANSFERPYLKNNQHKNGLAR
jgi:hypothetical protein